jgi:L-2-hydroxyglutarate oxidase LhgO
MEQVDCLIIGAGVIGLAIARSLSMQGIEVLVLDKETSFGMETSSRNSEVIHAGIYYPKDSLKTKLCVEGRDLLYSYCQERHISHKKCGKLIVACTGQEVDTLKTIQKKAKGNGVHNLAFLSREQVLEKEPDLDVVAGLFSPDTGIIDSHNFMLSLLGDIENNGGTFVPRSKFISGKITSDKFIVNICDTESGQELKIQTKTLINAAGLYAGPLLENLKGFPQKHIPKTYYAKGHYFSLSGTTTFKHLIYPVPEAGGLGIHLTLDMGGGAKFGPNVEWIDEISDYAADEKLRDVFFENIKKYWPAVKKEALVPGYTGIRPKTAPRGSENDFVIQTEKEHGIANLVNLLGIESPGLTSSLAIAAAVEKSILNSSR